jgi:type II secretory pathway component PulC
MPSNCQLACQRLDALFFTGYTGPMRMNLSDTQQSQVMMVVNGLLLLAIIWLGLSDAFTIKPPAVHMAPITHDIRANHHSLVSALPSYHLFGQIESEASMPTTDLNLELAGVFANSDAKQARAAISVNGDATKLFSIGQTILPGVTLNKVFDTKIYINNQGRTEQLDMKLKYPSLQS